MAANKLRKVIMNEWLLIAAGVASQAFGEFLIAGPAVGALAVTLWIGGYGVVMGILLVALAFRLRNWGQTLATTQTGL